MASTTSKSSGGDLKVIAMAVIGVAIYAVGTLLVVQQAGGDKVESTYSNTPNAVVPGPPAFK